MSEDHQGQAPVDGHSSKAGNRAEGGIGGKDGEVVLAPAPAALAGPAERAGVVAARAALRQALEQSRLFHLDSAIGGILHRGTNSYRELSPLNSVHITVDGTHVTAHVDRVSPIEQNADGKTRYSWRKVVVHCIYAIGDGLGCRLRGQEGSQHCSLDCEVVWVDDDDDVGQSGEEAGCPTSSGEKTSPQPAGGRG